MKTLLATTALAWRYRPRPQWLFRRLDEGRHLTVRGTIVESAFTDNWQRREIRQNFLAIALDRPRCAAGGKITGIIIVALFGVSQTWLGHHLAMETDVAVGETIYYPTVVNFTPTKIWTFNSSGASGNPAVHRAVIHLEAALKIAIAQRIAQAPCHRLNYQPGLEMASFEIVFGLTLELLGNRFKFTVPLLNSRSKIPRQDNDPVNA